MDLGTIACKDITLPRPQLTSLIVYHVARLLGKCELNLVYHDQIVVWLDFQGLAKI